MSTGNWNWKRLAVLGAGTVVSIGLAVALYRKLVWGRQQRKRADNSGTGAAGTDASDNRSAGGSQARGPETGFDVAVRAVSEGRVGSIPNEVKLQLYGLYKVATVGKNTTEKPSRLDPYATAKWTAWTTASELEQDEAREGYVQLVEELLESRGQSLASVMGLKSASATPSSTSPAAASAPSSDGATGAAASGGSGGSGMDGFGSRFSTSFTVPDDRLPAGTDAAALQALLAQLGDVSQDLGELAAAGNIEGIKAALQRGVDVNAGDEYGQTPLMRAADRGRVAAIHVLLGAGADLHATDTDGNTAVQLAAISGEVEAAVALIRAGADPTLPEEVEKDVVAAIQAALLPRTP